MAGIVVFHPKNEDIVKSDIVTATGKYKYPRQIKGVLCSLTTDDVYSGQLQVTGDNLWALFFGPVRDRTSYVLYIFDANDPSIHAAPIQLKVANAFSTAHTVILYPTDPTVLYVRALVAVGTTTANSIDLAELRHAGVAAIPANEAMPVIPIGRYWVVSFTIPDDHPCPGNYTLHIEDNLGPPHPEVENISLDQDTLCPEMLRKAKAKSKKKKTKKKKKKATRAKKK